jgi:amino acid adenylation domain-containing protein
MPPYQRSLFSGFLRAAVDWPDRPALRVEGQQLSYAELRHQACSLAATLQHDAPSEGSPLTAVFAYRSVVAFTGVLAALLRGHGYVPLNRTFPVARTRAMLERSRCRALIVDAASAAQLDELLEGLERELYIVLPAEADAPGFSLRWPRHTFASMTGLLPAEQWRQVAVPAVAIAYLLFTSGSTGIPKGVMVTHGNVLPFVDSMVDRYVITEEDRFSQTFDMTFDLSVFDMFVAWERGASLHCPAERELIQPGRFIRESGLTIWFSVPSTGIFMRRLGALKPASYPSLRVSLFCGEPLPMAVADAWAQAAPNSIVENLYGPTEVTIACTLYRWDPATTPTQGERGLVPIGEPYPGMQCLVVDDALAEVAEGGVGELLMTGPQVTPGYWEDPEKTRASFVEPPGRGTIYYRTGDLVRRPSPGQPMVYLRRKDHQIKVQGHRVELGEVEAVLRDASGVDAVVALGWPITEQGAGGIVAFVGAMDLDVPQLSSACAARLPGYMVPRTIHLRERLPLNSNGKFDRNALLEILKETI